MRQALKSLALMVAVIFLIFAIPRLAHCFDVRPGVGVELFELREMVEKEEALGNMCIDYRSKLGLKGIGDDSDCDSLKECYRGCPLIKPDRQE